MDSFKEIEAKRRKLDEELDLQEKRGRLNKFVPEVPDWNQAGLATTTEAALGNHVSGIQFQQCGGGAQGYPQEDWGCVVGESKADELAWFIMKFLERRNGGELEKSITEMKVGDYRRLHEELALILQHEAKPPNWI